MEQKPVPRLRGYSRAAEDFCRSRRSLSRLRLHLLALACACVSSPAWAQQTPAPAQTVGDQQEQRERAEREARERAARQAVPAVGAKDSAPRDSDFHSTRLPHEAPCFTLSTLELDGDAGGDFGFAARYLQQYAGRCVGQEGIGLLVRRVQDLILSKGYITTRVGLPEQNLAGGIFTLLVIPGRIRAIRFTDPALPDSLWKSAFPLRPGDLLNIRALEQGLEQLKRVPSQDATMELVPGDKPGESDVVITLKQQRAVRGSVTFDDSGSDLTSRPQLNASLYLDNLLRRNDMLTLGLGTGMTRKSGQGTDSYSAAYTLPQGNWRWGASAYGYRYHQAVHGNTRDYQIAGQSQTAETTLERLFARGQRYRSSLDLKLGQRQSHTFVAGSEVITQKRKQTYAELGANLREYLGPAQLDLRLAHRRGLPWLGGDQDRHPRFDDTPTLRYRINSFDASLDLPFRTGAWRSDWSSQLHWQQSPDLLYGSELAPIGGRYTVNGFDGEQTLAGRTGGYWRNSLSFAVHRAFQPYVGADVGRIEDVRRIELKGGTLAGAYIGVRGNAWGTISWDGFVAWPLLHPSTWAPKGHTTGFRISLQF